MRWSSEYGRIHTEGDSDGYLQEIDIDEYDDDYFPDDDEVGVGVEHFEAIKGDFLFLVGFELLQGGVDFAIEAIEVTILFVVVIVVILLVVCDMMSTTT